MVISNKALILIIKELSGLSQYNEKRTDGAAIMLWVPAEDARVVTIPDTYDLSHIGETAETARDAATEVATKNL